MGSICKYVRCRVPGGAGGGFWVLGPLLLPPQQHGGHEAAQTNHADLFFPFLWPRKEIDAELRSARQTAPWHEDRRSSTAGQHPAAAPQPGCFRDRGVTELLMDTGAVPPCCHCRAGLCVFVPIEGTAGPMPHPSAAAPPVWPFPFPNPAVIAPAMPTPPKPDQRWNENAATATPGRCQPVTRGQSQLPQVTLVARRSQPGEHHRPRAIVSSSPGSPLGGGSFAGDHCMGRTPALWARCKTLEASAQPWLWGGFSVPAFG